MLSNSQTCIYSILSHCFLQLVVTFGLFLSSFWPNMIRNNDNYPKPDVASVSSVLNSATGTPLRATRGANMAAG